MKSTFNSTLNKSSDLSQPASNSCQPNRSSTDPLSSRRWLLSMHPSQWEPLNQWPIQLPQEEVRPRWPPCLKDNTSHLSMLSSKPLQATLLLDSISILPRRTVQPSCPTTERVLVPLPPAPKVSDSLPWVPSLLVAVATCHRPEFPATLTSRPIEKTILVNSLDYQALLTLWHEF